MLRRTFVIAGLGLLVGYSLGISHYGASLFSDEPAEKLEFQPAGSFNLCSIHSGSTNRLKSQRSV